MKQGSGRVLWKEGMFIYPQHFQQLDLYLEHRMSNLANMGSSVMWGVSTLSIDSDAVANGLVRVTEFQGITPDGTIITTADLPEEARQFDNFSEEKLEVFIGIPVFKENAGNCLLGSGGSNRFRYYENNRQVNDCNTGDNEREISFIKMNLQYLFSGGNLNDFSLIKIAEILKDGAGGFELNKRFIPPSINIHGVLKEMLHGLLDLLSTKSSSLAMQIRSGSRGSVELGASNISNFWLYHTINSFIPVLIHYLNSGHKHPELLYERLSSFLGGLYTFASKGHPKDVPLYIHTDLFQTFNDLINIVRDLTSIIVAKKCTSINLERVRQSMWIGKLLNDSLLENTTFYLAVASGLQDDQLITAVLKRMKIASQDNIDIVVNSAMDGITLKYTDELPPTLPLKSGYQYFLIDNKCEFWDSVVKSHVLAIYVPNNITGIKLDLVAVDN